jgi:peptide/nickel transport system substrate-binding protein
LAYPRADIIEKIVKPINSKSVLMNSLLTFPAESGYASAIANNGSSKFSAGTQAERTAKALALVKKYYPDAAAGSGAVKIKLLWGQPSNTRRAAEAALVKAEEAKAGFDVTTTGTTGWSGFLSDNSYDAQFFAWVKSSITQKGNSDLFCSDCSNNHLGYENPKLDAIVKELGATLLPKATVAAKYLAVENMLMDDAVSLPIFQHPGVAGINSALKGVDPSPLSPNLVWNLWDWHF